MREDGPRARVRRRTGERRNIQKRVRVREFGKRGKHQVIKHKLCNHSDTLPTDVTDVKIGEKFVVMVLSCQTSVSSTRSLIFFFQRPLTVNSSIRDHSRRTMLWEFFDLVIWTLFSSRWDTPITRQLLRSKSRRLRSKLTNRVPTRPLRSAIG